MVHVLQQDAAGRLIERSPLLPSAQNPPRLDDNFFRQHHTTICSLFRVQNVRKSLLVRFGRDKVGMLDLDATGTGESERTKVCYIAALTTATR